MSIRILKGSYWVDFRFNNKRYRKRSPLNTKAGAQGYEACLRQKLAIGEPIDEPEQEEKKCPTFEEFSWHWFNTYAKTNNKGSEVRNKEIALRVHLIPFFGKTRIDKISNRQIEEYKAKKVASKKLSNKTINNHLTAFVKCLRTAIDWEIIENMPKVKKLKVPVQKFDFLTNEESSLLLKHSHGIWKHLFLIALKTGLRQGEILALTWEDINWRNNQITVRQSMYNDVLSTTKGNNIRYIIMTSDVANSLATLRRESGFVFTDENNKHFSRWRINETLERVCKKAGLRKITCHVFRHTFASNLAMAGASIQAIQQLLGHSDIQTTMRYAHLNQNALRDTISLLEPNPNNDDFGQPAVNQAKKFNEIISSITTNNPKILPNNKQKQPR